MANQIVRSEEEIEEVLDWAREGEAQGTHYSGMSYEQGIIEMFRWLVGESDDRPDAEE